MSEEEIRAIVQESAQGGAIEKIEQSIVQRVFALGDRRVSELMTHRGDLVWFNLDDDLKTVKKKPVRKNILFTSFAATVIWMISPASCL